MLANLNGWHIVIAVAVIILLFGSTKLPAPARSLGQSARILRTESETTDVSRDAADRSE